MRGPGAPLLRPAELPETPGAQPSGRSPSPGEIQPLRDVPPALHQGITELRGWKVLGTAARSLRTTLPVSTLLGAIAAFHYGGGADQVPADVTITHALLWSAIVMESGLLPTVIRHASPRIKRLFTWLRTWPDQVAQYNLMGYAARSRKHSWLMKLAACLRCRDMVDHLWTMEPCKGASSAREITGLVHAHVARAWMEDHIADADSFRAFNDYRGQWTLNNSSSLPSTVVLMSVSRPFDESVLVWHLATDFCFHFLHGDPSRVNATARRCIEVSNYMAYLLFVKPEMLMPGARRNLFKDACRELVGLLQEDRPDAPRGRGMRGLARRVVQQLKRDDDDVLASVRGLTHKLLNLLNKDDDGVLGSGGVGVVRLACCVAKDLMNSHSGNEEKIWTVIQGVWVEMLCFTASRCKGYLHAKSLGTGGEC
jgi:hypothetical protein